MISNLWVEKRKVYWERMTVLVGLVEQTGLRTLSKEELREMALLYRQIASDLGVGSVVMGSVRQNAGRARQRFRVRQQFCFPHARLAASRATSPRCCCN